MRIAGYSLTIVKTRLVSTGNVCIIPNNIRVRYRNNNNNSFVRNARRTFHATVGTRVGRNAADVFPALSSSAMPVVRTTTRAYAELVTRPSDPMLNLRLRKRCLGVGVTNNRVPRGVGSPSPGRCVPVMRG